MTSAPQGRPGCSAELAPGCGHYHCLCKRQRGRRRFRPPRLSPRRNLKPSPHLRRPLPRFVRAHTPHARPAISCALPHPCKAAAGYAPPTAITELLEPIARRTACGCGARKSSFQPEPKPHAIGLRPKMCPKSPLRSVMRSPRTQIASAISLVMRNMAVQRFVLVRAFCEEGEELSVSSFLRDTLATPPPRLHKETRNQRIPLYWERAGSPRHAVCQRSGAFSLSNATQGVLAYATSRCSAASVV